MNIDSYSLALAVLLVMAGAWWLRRVFPVLIGPALHLAKLAHAQLPASVQRIIVSTGQQPWLQREPHELIVGFIGYLGFYGLVVALPLPALWQCSLATLPLWRYMQLRHAHRQYVARVISHWPAVLDLLAMLLQAGLSWRAALHAMNELETSSAALYQLQLVQQQLSIGMSTTSSLTELSLRIPAAEIKVFVAAVSQSQLTGASLAETLQLQAQRIRSEQQLRAEKQAQEMSIKLLFPLVTCFFPVTFILLLGPIFLGFITNT